VVTGTTEAAVAEGLIERNAQGAQLQAEYASLVSAAAAGRPHAMERLLMRAQEVAYRFSLLVCGHAEDAEDVMQEALLKTYQHVKQIADPAAFRTWLYSTVRNACLMKRRRRVGEPAAFVALEEQRGPDGRNTQAAMQIADAAPPADARLIADASDRRLRAALQALPPAYRAILVLRDIEELTTREVAAITGYSEANVKQRVHRARLMLRRHLEAS
jgi:RNA polymerase sigma-70 factor, ECF subfamily